MAIPTVFIGIGGQGQEIVKNLYKKVNEIIETGFAEFNPALYQYVLMDPVPISRSRFPSSKIMPKPYIIQMQGFDRNSVAQQMAAHSHLKRFWYPMYECDPCWHGYGAVRINGRMGLFLSCMEDFNPTVQRLEAAIQAANSAGIKSETINTSLQVFVIGSICGGTGAGAILDIGFLLRGLAYQRGYSPHLNACLILPDVMNKFVSAKDSLYANGYAFLRELNWYMAKPSPGDRTSIRNVYYKGKFGSGLNLDESNKSDFDKECAFDRCYTVSCSGQKGTNIQDSRDIVQMISNTLYLLTVGTNASEYAVNTLKANMDKDWPSKFGGFGSFTLRFPAQSVCTYLTKEASEILLEQWIISPPNAERDAQAQFNKLEAGPNPLEVTKVLGQISSKFRQNLTFNKERQRIHAKNYPLVNFLKQVHQRVTEHYKDGTSFAYNLSEEVAQYRKKVVKDIKAAIDEIFSAQDNPDAAGEAMYYLEKIKQYCIAQVGSSDEVERAPDNPTLSQIADNKISEANALIGEHSSERKQAEAEWGWTPWDKNDYRDEAVQLAIKLSTSIYQSRIYRELHQMYKDIRDFVIKKQRPLTFLRDIAAKLKEDYDGQSYEGILAKESVLRGDDTNKPAIEELICTTRKFVENNIQSYIPFFQKDGKAVKDSLVLIMEEIKELVRDTWEELADFGGDQAAFMQKNFARYRNNLERLLKEHIGKPIMAELRKKYSIGHILYCDAIEQGHSDDPVSHVKQKLDRLFNMSTDIYSGFNTVNPQKGSHIQMNKIVCLNEQAFVEAVTNASGQAFDMDHEIKDNDLDDPFRITILEAQANLPIYLLKGLGKYRGLYDKLHNAQAYAEKPLHTDWRFEDESHEYDYTLPHIELTGEADDDDIFLFVLAEQNWWIGLKGFVNNPRDRWAGDLTPLVKQNSQAYYSWQGISMHRDSAGKDGCKGRNHAQETFINDRMGIKESIREMIAERWNNAYSPVERRELLTELKQKLEQMANETNHKVLIRCYSREANIIGDRLDSNKLTI